MLLYPKKTIYGKNYSRKKITVNQKQPDSFAFGDFSVVAKESGRVTQKQLEYLKRFLQRKLKKESKIWIRIFPSTPLTKKTAGVRLGIGKGSVKYWVCSVRSGQSLAEIKGCGSLLAKSSIFSTGFKLSINVIFLNKYLRWIL